jgi:hypothetical protein
MAKLGVDKQNISTEEELLYTFLTRPLTTHTTSTMALSQPQGVFAALKSLPKPSVSLAASSRAPHGQRRRNANLANFRIPEVKNEPNVC